MKKRLVSMMLVFCLILTVLPVYADVSVQMIEEDINTDGSYQSHRWFSIFKDLLPEKAANKARLFIALSSLRDPVLQSQVSTVLNTDPTRKTRLAAYGLNATTIYQVMDYYLDTLPLDSAQMDALEFTPKVNLYADLYHDKELKYSNYMVDFHVYLNNLFDRLPYQVQAPITLWDRQNQGEIILYQSLLNIIIRTKLGTENYYDGSLVSRSLGLFTVTEAMIANDLKNYASSTGPLTSSEEIAIDEYAKMFTDFGNVILESIELNLETSGQLNSIFEIGKDINVIRSFSDFSEDDPDPITINVNPDGQTIQSAPQPGEKSSQDFDEFLTGYSGPVDWSVSRPDLVNIDSDGLLTLASTFPDDPEEIYSVRVRATIRGRSEFAEVFVFIESPEALGFTEFYGPYISGYEDGTFREFNNITRAEAATMFTRVLQFDVKSYEKDENGAFVLSPENQRIPVYVTADDYETPSYNDVNKNNWAYSYIEIAKENKLFDGIVNGKFEPNKAMTRAEIAVLITNAWDALGIKEDLVPRHYVSDVTTTHWAFDSIVRVYNYGIVTGYEDNTFRPDESITREHIVLMINKVINRKVALVNEASFSDIPTDHSSFGHIEAATKEQVKINNIGN